jgi:hypothetical protein
MATGCKQEMISLLNMSGTKRPKDLKGEICVLPPISRKLTRKNLRTSSK